MCLSHGRHLLSWIFCWFVRFACSLSYCLLLVWSFALPHVFLCMYFYIDLPTIDYRCLHLFTLSDQQTEQDRREWEERSTDQKLWKSGGVSEASRQMSRPRLLQMCFLKFRMDTEPCLVPPASTVWTVPPPFRSSLLWGASRHLEEDDWHFPRRTTQRLVCDKAWKVNKLPTWASQTPTVCRWTQEASSVGHFKYPPPSFT